MGEAHGGAKSCAHCTASCMHHAAVVLRAMHYAAAHVLTIAAPRQLPKRHCTRTALHHKTTSVPSAQAHTHRRHVACDACTQKALHIRAVGRLVVAQAHEQALPELRATVERLDDKGARKEQDELRGDEAHGTGLKDDM